MKKILFPLQKIFLLLFYVEMITIVDKHLFIFIATLLLLLSLKVEGAKLYTPLLFILLILKWFDFSVILLVLVLALGLLMILFKIYDINVPEKGQYSIGHKYLSIDVNQSPQKTYKLDISLFYPGEKGAKGKKVEWVPNNEYNKTLYEIFFVDPNAKRIPYFIFEFTISYIHKIFMPVEGGIPYCQDQNNKNKDKVIVFSHGLGAFMNCYSCILGSLASQGYTIAAINHVRDEICMNYKQASEHDEKLIRAYLFKKRNRDLVIRREEVLKTADSILESDLLRDSLHEDFSVEQIILAGQSYGGATVTDTKAYINANYQNSKKKYFKRVICYDPWYFPLEDSQYQLLKNQDILIINSHHFYEKVPKQYLLQEKLQMLKNNSPTLSAFMVREMDHIGQSDMTYVFASILQFTNSIRRQSLSNQFIQLLQLMSKWFLEGKTREQILDLGNEYCALKGIDKMGVAVKEQYRYTHELTMQK